MTPTGTIHIDGLRVYAYHGVAEQESIIGNTFEVSLKLRFKAEHAMRSDRLDLTINYGDLVDLIKQEITFPSKLIENVVYRLYQAIKDRYTNVMGGEISIYKLQPPISAELNRIGFTFTW